MKTKKFDRAINPSDGSRRRLKSEEHKTEKDYKRFSKSELHRLLQSGEIDIEEYLKNSKDDQT